MKAKYLKPTAEDLLLTDDLMISASADGNAIVSEGGDTDTEGITVADARHNSVWDEEEENW